jgi:FixJ family two-component response regulator
MRPPPPKVYVVDDNAAVRDSIACLFRSVGLAMEGYESDEEFLADYDPGRPGCLVLDVRMSGMSGVELHAKLRERGNMLPIIFLTGHGDVPMAVRAMQDGAVDFLEKPVRQDALMASVRRALAVDESARRAAKDRATIVARLETLTPRQKEVLKLMQAGHANKMIAYLLGVTEKTIEFHRARIMKKMQAAGLAQLMRMVLSLGEEGAR